MIANHKNWAVRIATLNLPANTKMPGTVGSGLVLIYLTGFCVINLLSNFYPALQVLSFASYNLLVPVIASLIALLIISRALKFFTQKDPGLICLDEVVGMLVSMCLIPINFATVLIGFLLFRFFDILKPFGIKQIEQLQGAWGVLFDDFLAGVYANLSLRLIIWLFIRVALFFE